jgi:hypothetical protein
MAPVLWAVMVVYLAASMVFAGFLVHHVTNGRHLDAILVRVRLLGWPPRASGATRFERRVMRGVLAASVRDAGGDLLWLPDSIEVLLAPRDLRRLGPAAERLRRQLLERLEALIAAGRCRCHARPVVSIAESPTCRSGRPSLRLAFGEATDRATMSVGNVHPGPWTPGGTPPRHRAQLRPVRPPGQSILLRSDHRFRIGRLPSCELVIEQPTVSRFHAVVYERDGAWYVADQQSTNGTFVNLSPITGPVRLGNTDEIRLGESVSLRFELRPPPRWSTWRRSAPHDR